MFVVLHFLFVLKNDKLIFFFAIQLIIEFQHVCPQKLIYRMGRWWFAIIFFNFHEISSLSLFFLSKLLRRWLKFYAVNVFSIYENFNIINILYLLLSRSQETYTHYKYLVLEMLLLVCFVYMYKMKLASSEKILHLENSRSHFVIVFVCWYIRCIRTLIKYTL